jgi:hypothetical protein
MENKRYIRTIEGFVGETNPANVVTDIETAYGLGECCRNDFMIGQMIVTTETSPAFLFVVTAVTPTVLTLGTVTVT